MGRCKGFLGELYLGGLLGQISRFKEHLEIYL